MPIWQFVMCVSRMILCMNLAAHGPYFPFVRLFFLYQIREKQEPSDVLGEVSRTHHAIQ